MIVRARAPLRLGLAGGGSDVDPYCSLYGGYVLNATIDKYAYAVISPATNNRVRFMAADLEISFESDSEESITLAGPLKLHQAVYNEIVGNYCNHKPLSIQVTTFCDAPMGSGLGSSSTVVVAMIKAYVELLNLPLDDYAIARLAFKVERMDCGFQGGRQDQYSATFGGVNFIEFNPGDHVVVNSLRIKNWILCELEASLLLFYTGVSRESAKIIADQSSNMSSGDDGMLEAFQSIKAEAVNMKECLLKGDFSGIVDSMRKGWESKKKSAVAVSTPKIEKIYNSAISAGALAGKVSGAGGGGYMMLFVPPNLRMNVIRALGNFDGIVSSVHLTGNGAQAWRIK